MGFGRFKGGQHFNKLNVSKVKYSKPIKEPRATIEQLAELKLLGLNFQLNSISSKKASNLINRLKESKDREIDGLNRKV